MSDISCAAFRPTALDITHESKTLMVSLGPGAGVGAGAVVGPGTVGAVVGVTFVAGIAVVGTTEGALVPVG